MTDAPFIPKFHDWHVIARVVAIMAAAAWFWQMARSRSESPGWRILGYIAVPVLAVISLLYMGVFFGWWQ